MIRVEGYDEYVKEFEELRKNADILPKTEEEVAEWADFELSEHGCDWPLEHRLEAEETKKGREVTFYFDFSFPERGVPYVLYKCAI